MANIAAQRLKREFKEVIKSEEVRFLYFNPSKSIAFSSILHIIFNLNSSFAIVTQFPQMEIISLVIDKFSIF